MGLFKAIKSMFKGSQQNKRRYGSSNFYHDPNVWSRDKESGYWHNHDEGWGHRDGDCKVSNKGDFD